MARKIKKDTLEEEYAAVVERLSSRGVWVPDFMSREESIDVIKRAIAKGGRFNFVRFGDGEVGGFVKDHKRSCAWRNRLQSVWSSGTKTYEHILAKGCEIIEDAIKGADAIGLLSLLDRVRDISVDDSLAKKFIIRDLSERSVDMWCKFWLFTKEYFDDRGVDISKKVFVDHQLSRTPSLGDANKFAQMIYGKKLVIVSPHARFFTEYRLNDMLRSDVGYVEIPWKRDKDQCHFDIDEDIYPIVEKVQMHEPDIVAFGGAVKMKNIGNYLHCVCLDFGATLDAWAGMRTRMALRNGNVQAGCVLNLSGVVTKGEACPM